VHAARATRAIAPSGTQRSFTVARGADISLAYSETAPPRPSRGDLLFDSGGVWRVYEHDGGWLYEFESPRLKPRPYKAVRIDRDFRRGELHFPPTPSGPRPRSALDFPLDELLFQHYFARRGSLEIHSCAVEVRGGAALFCGQSGAGKTTTALLWRRHHRASRILTDDRTILTFRRGRPWVYGTPWHGLGRFALPVGRPLRGIFFLEHAPETRLDRLSRLDAAARLFSRGFPPPWEREALERALETCDRAVEQVPCYRFGFLPDRSAVQAVLDLLGRPRSRTR
jgi:hypothetical protein